MEYGHYFYSKYAPQTDTVFVVLLLLVVFSIFGPVAQRSKYQHACTFLITAAVKGWSLQQGGTKEVCRVGGWGSGGEGGREGGREAGRQACGQAPSSHHLLFMSGAHATTTTTPETKQTLEIRRRALEQVRAKKGGFDFSYT